MTKGHNGQFPECPIAEFAAEDFLNRAPGDLSEATDEIGRAKLSAEKANVLLRARWYEAAKNAVEVFKEEEDPTIASSRWWTNRCAGDTHRGFLFFVENIDYAAD